MKKQYRFVTLAFAMTAGFLSACERQDADQPQPQESVIQKRQLSQEEKQRVENFKKAAYVLSELIKADKSIVSDLRSGISISRPGQQNISFKELVDASSLVGSKRLNSFENSFLLAQNKIYGQQANRGAVETSLFEELVADGAQIYFPYEEELNTSNEPLTVAYDPIDNSDVSIGYQYDSNGEIQEVVVDDEYAQQHPTIIIMEDDAAEVPGDVALQPMRPTAIGDTVNEVYVGCVKLSKNMDGIFDGNNEVVFVRSDAFIRINATGQVESGSNGYVTKNADISRVNARDKNWVYKNILFEPDWDRTEKSAHFAVYEHDPHQTKTQKTSTSLGINNPKTGLTVNQSVENTLTYSTDHRLFGSQNYGRNQFFNTNTIPLWGGTLKDGFRVYVDDVIQYNHPRRTLIFR